MYSRHICLETQFVYEFVVDLDNSYKFSKLQNNCLAFVVGLVGSLMTVLYLN